MKTIKNAYIILLLVGGFSFLLDAKHNKKTARPLKQKQNQQSLDMDSVKEKEPLTPEQLELKENHPLFFAVQMNQYDEVVRLLEQGCAVDGKNYKNPLHEAVRHDYANIVELLLQHGADVNRLDYYGYTPLLKAAYWNSYQAAQLLLRWNANLNIQECYYGYTAIHTAVYYGYEAMTKLLISAGANLNIQNYSGNTVLHYAADAKHEGLSGLFCAIVCPFFYRYHPEQDKIVKVLIAAGVDVNLVNKENKTALWNAVKNDFYKVTELLLKAHASVDIRDDNNKTVFDYTQDAKILKLLHKY
jgi:uncharacterized protein